MTLDPKVPPFAQFYNKQEFSVKFKQHHFEVFIGFKLHT